MSDSKFPYVRAAFINAIREEGTKEQACNYLQEEWNRSSAQARHIAELQGQNIAQAAELTRLRARIEAADKLAEAATPYVSPVQNGDYARQLRQHNALVAALSAYEGGNE